MALILSEKDLEPLFSDPASMDSLRGTIEEVLRARQRGEITSQGGYPLPMADGKRNFRLVTASLPGAGELLRVVPQFRGSKDSHLNLLFDAQNGDLLAVMAGGELNVWRTGTPAGIACGYLALSGAKVLGLLGSGPQARGQLLAVRRSVPSLERVRLFSPTKEHRSAFADKMGPWLGIEVEPVDNPRAAVEGAHIVSLATSSRATVIESDWISPGTLVISITSGQLPKELVARSRVVASGKEEVLQSQPPREPYASMIASGSWSGDKIGAELGEVILGKVTGRQNEREVIVFELTGMPAWDAATAAWAYRWALNHEAGTPFSLA
ncbi:MAG: ornithine cyclodeaminase family protein [Deltaproteobacteria bacterium]|nr:ornithine cyclodeaminase family protein [Deltaproteobacteria bacterium]